MRRHTKEIRLRCTECSGKFTLPAQLEAHRCAKKRKLDIGRTIGTHCQPYAIINRSSANVTLHPDHGGARSRYPARCPRFDRSTELRTHWSDAATETPIVSRRYVTVAQINGTPAAQVPVLVMSQDEHLGSDASTGVGTNTGPPHPENRIVQLVTADTQGTPLPVLLSRQDEHIGTKASTEVGRNTGPSHPGKSVVQFNQADEIETELHPHFVSQIEHAGSSARHQHGQNCDRQFSHDSVEAHPQALSEDVGNVNEDEDHVLYPYIDRDGISKILDDLFRDDRL